MVNAITIKNLFKTYGEHNAPGSKLALNDLTLEVPKGRIMGLLGANGAGKSSLINILAGIVTKTSGTVEIAGVCIDRDPQKAKMHIGVVPQEIYLDTFFPIGQALEFFAGYYGIRPEHRKTEEILKNLSLWDKRYSLPHKLSGGMKRRFLIAKAMVHAPEILILDEPTAGVDLDLRENLWSYVGELNAKGTTIILTTHYLEEAQRMCDDIAFIHNGKIVRHSSKEKLFQDFGRRYLEIEFDQEVDMTSIPMQCRALGNNKFSFAMDSINGQYVSRIFNSVSAIGANIKNIRVIEPDLTEIFHKIMQNG